MVSHPHMWASPSFLTESKRSSHVVSKLAGATAGSSTASTTAGAASGASFGAAPSGAATPSFASVRRQEKLGATLDERHHTTGHSFTDVCTGSVSSAQRRLTAGTGQPQSPHRCFAARPAVMSTIDKAFNIIMTASVCRPIVR